MSRFEDAHDCAYAVVERAWLDQELTGWWIVTSEGGLPALAKAEQLPENCAWSEAPRGLTPNELAERFEEYAHRVVEIGRALEAQGFPAEL